MFFFIAILLIAAGYFLSILLQRRKILVNLKNSFTVPPTWLFIGHLPLFPNNLPGLFKVLVDLIKQYGKNTIIIGPLYLFTLVISDPVDVETVLANSNSKSMKKSFEYDLLKPWLGTGLLTSDGEKWFQRRKIITSSFHFTILENFVQVMNRQSDILVENLRVKVENGIFNIYNYITLFALDVICEASMGIAINAQSAPNSEYVLAVKEISSLIHKRWFSFLKRLPGAYVLFPSGRRHRHLIKVLHAFTTNIIVNRRHKILSGSHDQKTTKMNLIDMLLYAAIEGKPLSDEDIREEVDTFMFEGHDTTTSGIAFTLYELAKHQNFQEKVYQETKEVYEKMPSTEITYQKLSELKYLEMVIKETLRIMPSVPFIGRQLTEDVVIGNNTIPSGTNLGISIYSIHHDPDNFPAPEKFDPERFSPQSKQERHLFSFIPFSAGGRNCIGQKFAMLEMKTVISKIIMNYRLLPNNDGNDISLQADLILKSFNVIVIISRGLTVLLHVLSFKYRNKRCRNMEMIISMMPFNLCQSDRNNFIHMKACVYGTLKKCSFI